jgi:hypothetical protein
MAKTISNSAYATSGFTLTSANNPLSVTSTGTIGRTAATGGHAAIYGAGGAGTNWTINNSGHVAGTASSLFGINLGYFGPTVTSALIINNSGGVITGQQYGIITDGSTTITNASGGTVSASGNDVVFLQTNGTVVNYGLITNASATGLYLQSGGVVVNGSTGTIAVNTGQGGTGVRLSAAGTVTNAGTIIGGTGGAVGFGMASSANKLIVDPGAVFQGGVNGGTGTLELASAASAGTLTATNFTGFNAIKFDPNSQWTLAGSTTALAGTITGFTTTDTIDLLGFFATANSYAGGNLTLTNSVNVHTTLHFSGGPFNTGTVHIATSAGGTVLTDLCYLAGTRIDTVNGEVLVENLAVGDLVLTLDGKAEPIVWLGKGKTLVTRGRRSAATPVIVRKGALAPNVPNRDLRVTKGHSLFIDGVLIPVEFLVNHRSIIWDDHAREVELYHIELATHDVLLANGAPAESYRDDGNRWLFQNANPGWSQPAKPPCAAILTGGAIVDAAWRRLLDRDGPRPGLPMTDDPDLHLRVDGQRVGSRSVGDGVYTFSLPTRPTHVRIASRSGAPDELGLARDPRELGVALRKVTLWHGDHPTVLEANDERLREGFHAVEESNGFRWTNGNALLPPTLFDGVGHNCTLELHVACTAQYPLLADEECVAA